MICPTKITPGSHTSEFSFCSNRVLGNLINIFSHWNWALFVRGNKNKPLQSLVTSLRFAISRADKVPTFSLTFFFQCKTLRLLAASHYCLSCHVWSTTSLSVCSVGLLRLHVRRNDDRRPSLFHGMLVLQVRARVVVTNSFFFAARKSRAKTTVASMGSSAPPTSRWNGQQKENYFVFFVFLSS